MYWGVGIKFDKSGVVRTLYKWHDPSKCLVWKGNEAKLGACTDSAAKHWGLSRLGQLSQDSGKWCVVRDLENNAHVQKCHDMIRHAHTLYM